MQILSRKDAIAAGAGQYLTGKPCKYGHYAHRYTQSGACAECVSQSGAVSRDALRQNAESIRDRLSQKRSEALTPILELKRAKHDALDRIVEIRIPIHRQDVRTVFDTAIELCLATFPCLERHDVTPENKPVKPDLPLYRVSVPADHVDVMRATAAQLWDARSNIDMAQVRADRLRKIEEMVDNESSEPPEGWK